MMLRIMPSDPAYQDANKVADWIAKLKNPHLFHDLKDLEDLFEELTH